MGSKRAIQISVGVTCIGMVGAVSTTPERILFAFPYDAAVSGPLWSFPYFQTLPELDWPAVSPAWDSSYRGSARSLLFAGACTGYRTRMRRILIWLFGVPLGLFVLTAWSRPPHHDVELVKAPVVDQRHDHG